MRRACNKSKGPLELEVLDDLSPEALWVKFQRVSEQISKRTGRFTEVSCIY